MTSFLALPYRSHQAQTELLGQLHWLLDQEHSLFSGDVAVPGDERVITVGKLQLLASPALQEIYALTLWPRVRANLGLDSPGMLTRGNYLPYIQRSRLLLESGMTLRLAARHEPTGRDAQWRDELVTLLLARIEAGCLLTGLEALWPEAGSAAARTLWQRGQLQDWDQYLRDSVTELAPAREVLRRVAVELPIPLDSPWFEGVRVMLGAPAETSDASALSIADDLVQDTLLLRLLLLEDFLCGAGESYSALATCRVLPADQQGLFFITSEAGLAGVWFAEPDEVALTLDAATATELDMLIRAEVLTLDGLDDEDLGQQTESDQPTGWIVRLHGTLDRAALIRRLDRQNSITLKKTLFTGDHEPTLAALREVLSVHFV